MSVGGMDSLVKSSPNTHTHTHKILDVNASGSPSLVSHRKRGPRAEMTSLRFKCKPSACPTLCQGFYGATWAWLLSPQFFSAHVLSFDGVSPQGDSVRVSVGL